MDIDPPPETPIFCSELHFPPVEGRAPMPPLVVVGAFDAGNIGETVPDTIDEDGRRRSHARQCSPEAAIVAADYLVSHALMLAPYLANSRALGSLIDALWPVIRDRADELIRSGPEGSKMLRHYVEREVQFRTGEELATRREAARLAGINANADLINRLWNCCVEDNPSARAVALAAIAGEVRHVLQR
jgi:hypothetical protein